MQIMVTFVLKSVRLDELWMMSLLFCVFGCIGFELFRIFVAELLY